jgi:hypothetical protein
VRIDTVDKRVVGILCKRIDILQLVHTRNTGRRKVLVKNGVWGFGDVALDNTDIAQTIGRCVVAEAVSTKVTHAGSPASNGSSSDTVSTIGSVRVVAVALTNSAASVSIVT